MHATDVNPLFYSALLLSALPVPLLRQVYLLVFSRSFFRMCFLFVFWRVLEWSFGARRVHFGAIWGSFGSHFGDFLRIRWISENVCFTLIKHQFWRFGRVLIPDFFLLFFLSVSFEHSSVTFVDFVGPLGLLRDPNGSHFGSLRGQIWV